MHIAKGIEFYIELKGQDLEHALEQIKSTIFRLSTNVKKGNKISYIICTRSPMSSSEIQNHKLEFRKKFNSKLEIKSSPFKDKY
jgi:glycerophosphoryl diester phosphodiesterase